jgi:hypothetical protein
VGGIVRNILIWLGTSAVLGGLAGGGLCAVGYELQTAKTHDIWTHVINGTATGAFVGMIAGLLLRAMVKMIQSRGVRPMERHRQPDDLRDR